MTPRHEPPPPSAAAPEPHEPAPSSDAERRERLAALERAGATAAEALAFYDTLPAVPAEDLRGEWAGSTLPSGHPLDGALERLGWYGKRFDGPDDAHPLLFDDGRGGAVAIDPARVPLPVVRRWPRGAHHAAVVRAFRAVLPVLRTTRPRARLRETRYRGVVTGTLVYDAVPVLDAFRRVDADTLVGAMDMRGLAGTYLFVLRRR